MKTMYKRLLYPNGLQMLLKVTFIKERILPGKNKRVLNKELAHSSAKKKGL